MAAMRPVEVARVRAYLAAPSAAAALVVLGPRGVGKTTLLRQAAAEVPAAQVLRFDGGGPGSGGPTLAFAERLEAWEVATLTALSALRQAGGPAVTYVDVFRHLLMPDRARPADVEAVVAARTSTSNNSHSADRPSVETLWLDGVRRWARERGRGTIAAPLQLAYDVLVHRERTEAVSSTSGSDSAPRRSGRRVTPFLLGLLRETAADGEWVPKLVLENMPRLRGADDDDDRDADPQSAWVRALLRGRPDAPGGVPTVLEADHAAYAIAPLPGPPVDYVEVHGLELVQAQQWLAPALGSDAAVAQLYARVGGHPAHLRAMQAYAVSHALKLCEGAWPGSHTLALCRGASRSRLEEDGRTDVASATDAYLSAHAATVAARIDT
jgi:hypothetical protein